MSWGFLGVYNPGVVNHQGVVVWMLGFRTRVHGYENYAKGKQLGAVGDTHLL